jgi:RNA polymerase sigma-70 factor (ECF subfamily)
MSTSRAASSLTDDAPGGAGRVNMAPVSEAMERFRAGEPDAIRALYREYSGAVNTVAMSIVRDRELAADVVQQTFIKAWRAAASFEQGREVAPWLYSIARRTAIDALRSEARPTRGGHQPEVEVPVDSESIEQTWERFQVRRAVDALPPDEREVVRRSHLLGHTHEEIAEQLGVPVGTVKSRSARAHKRLAASLAHLQTTASSANQSATPSVLIDEEQR